MGLFQLSTEYAPAGDQPEAIRQITSNIEADVQNQVLLGVTGSGKTFTMAQVIARCNRPALILAHNKTLAAQLYNEFRQLFPQNAVEYFVSYYDYYQPEAYVPSADLYIEKDSAINDNIEKLRHAATYALFTRRDVIIVASVSCIYGLGSPEFYQKMMLPLEAGQPCLMDNVLRKLVEIQYTRNDYDFHRGTFRVRGDIIEIIPAYRHDEAIRLEFFGDVLESISEVDALTGQTLRTILKTVIYPASHYVSDKENLARAASDIRDELLERLVVLKQENKLLEVQRLEQRTSLDLEMMEELGYCPGIENYSRHLDNRATGVPPYCLLDYFPEDFLLFADESHISIPQVGAMFKGDRSRKQTLVDYGFRLPSALDNRPLTFDEFLERVGQAVYVSATPAPWEIKRSEGIVIEQVIRPTGLVDPVVEVRKSKGQMDDLMAECRARIKQSQRVLVTTLTKRMAEDLTEYLNGLGVAARYLHSDIDTLERMAIIRALRHKEFDVLVGINLLREGLDIPEVSLVVILDADKEGFLRSRGSLIQTFGRAARNVAGQVILYADRITRSMTEAMEESKRRRDKQLKFNQDNGITPASIVKELETPFDNLFSVHEEMGAYNKKGSRKAKEQLMHNALSDSELKVTPKELGKLIQGLEREMREAAKELEFEQAASIRDRLSILRQKLALSGKEDMV